MLGRRKRENLNKRQPAPEYKKQPIYSYRSSRKESKRQFNRGEDEEGKSSASPGFMLKATRLIVALIVVAGVFYFQSLSSSAKVKITGKESLRSAEVYENAVKSEMNSSKLNISKLTFNSTKIENDIKSQFPEIENIKISLPIFSHEPTFDISLGEPAALLVTSEKTYFIDGSGRALFTLADVPSSFDKKGLITVNDTSGHGIILGKPALTSSQIRFIKELRGQTSAKGINIDSMTLSNGGSVLNVAFSESKYTVKFSFMADARQSSGAYLAIRDQISQGNIKVSEYVDLRIPERAYIK